MKLNLQRKRVTLRVHLITHLLRDDERHLGVRDVYTRRSQVTSRNYNTVTCHILKGGRLTERPTKGADIPKIAISMRLLASRPAGRS